MLRDRMKRGAAFLLALCLVFTAAQFPPEAAWAAEGHNLARQEGVTATASSMETADFSADKAIDGDTSGRSSRWASAKKAGPQWIQLEWESAQTIQNIRIYWERKNVKNYKAQVSNNGTDWNDLYENPSYPAQNMQDISLDEAVSAKYLRIYIATVDEQGADTGETPWQTASMYELEVYDGEIPDGRSEAQKLVDSIDAPTVGAGDGAIPIPEAPEGGSIRFCADYEQVIGGDGTIYRPLETKTVKGFYEVSLPAGEGETEGSSAKSAEYTVTVPGQYDAAQGGNKKPEVIPELQEWHGLRGSFYAGASSKIVVKDDALADVAELFAKDYKDVTGLDIAVEKNATASDGDFVFAFAAEEGGLGKEGYTLDIGNFALIEAEQATGAYWATRTILQIIKQTKGSMPKGLVRDYPKYEVRGFILDVGRKAFTLDALYEFAENMAWYKMNSFQVHLSDNLIFHEDYPTLEEAAEHSYAGNRLQSDLKGSTGKTSTAEDVYYTKNDFRTFIQDCRVMGVDIVPEFDMPAHALPWTRAFPEFQALKAGGSHGYLIEELDLSKEGVDEWAKSVWNEYFEEGIFDEEMTIHIGTDEYHGTDGQQGREEFRRFSASLINFVQSKKRTVRMWGSLTNKQGNTPVPVEGVQLNIWSTGYADPSAMYNLGYGMINTLDGPNYIVPAAGYYHDYIDANNIYSSWKPNVIGNLTMKTGDDQMLGASYAIWHDSVDTRGNGISQYDSFDRFFQALPSYSAKLWGEAADKNYSEFSRLFSRTGTAPGTTICGDVESVSATVADYEFDSEDLAEDSSANGYDLTDKKNVEQVNVAGGNKALKLKGGESYVETPLNQIGSNAVLTMTVKMDTDATGEQILCESKDVCGTYGTYAFKASQKHTGKVGFSREGYDYSFNYTMPKGEWVTLEFHSGKDSVALYVNGELIDNKHYDENGELATTRKGNEDVVISKDNNPDIYFANHETTELSEKLAKEGITKIATMLVPMGRIGSTNNSFKGEIDKVAVSTDIEISEENGKIDRTGWTTNACSTHSSEGSQAAVLDGDKTTYWHQDWGSDTSLGDVTSIHPEGAHWFELTLPQATEVAKLTYLPRQDNANGRILEYSIVVTKENGEDETVASHKQWTNDNSLKTASFAPVTAKKVKLLIHSSQGSHATIAELNLYEAPLGLNDSKDALNQYIADCGSYNKADYGDMVWGEYEVALARAQKLAASQSENAEDYIAALEQLEQAVAALELSGQEKRDDALDKLDGTISEMEDLLENAGKGEYAEESIKALQEAINKAKEELSSKDATASELEAIRKALASFKLDTPEEAAKKKDLQSSVDTAKTLAADKNYTAASRKDLTDAIAEAEKALKAGATTDQMQALLEAIEAAKRKLAFITYTVTFDSKGGTAVKALTVESGKKAAKPADPTRVNYKFMGWSKTENGPAVSWPLSVTGNTKLYAKWEELSKFKDGAEMTDSKKKITYKVISAQNKTAMAFKGNNKKAGNVTIPATVVIEGQTCKVVAVGAGAFQGYNKMTKVTLGKNVTVIEKNAFAKCKKLKTITMKGKTLTKVQSGAFKNTAKNLTVKAPKGLNKAQKNKLLSQLKKGGNKKVKVK